MDPFDRLLGQRGLRCLYGRSVHEEGGTSSRDVAPLQQNNGALGTFSRLNGVSDYRCVMVVSNGAKKLFSSSPSVLLPAGLGLYSWLGPRMALHICPGIPSFPLIGVLGLFDSPLRSPLSPILKVELGSLIRVRTPFVIQGFLVGKTQFHCGSPEL